MYVYRITLVESEEGWGRKTWREDFSSPEEAQERIDSVNAKNTSPVAPSYYVMAYDDIKAVRVDTET